MSRVRTGYFVRGENVPAQLEHPFDVVVVPWRSLTHEPWGQACQALQDAGHEVHVHTPFSYINPSNQNARVEAIMAVLGDPRNGEGWLRDAHGELVGPGWKLIDPRATHIRRRLVKVHMDLITGANWVPDGLFLDFIWDRVAWFAEFNEHDEMFLDDEYRVGMYRFATGLKFALRRAGLPAKLYANGWHRCAIMDGTVCENFPLTKQEGGHRGLDVALWGYYGKATWERFEYPPLLLPVGGENIGYDIPKFRIVEAVAFANSYCPGAVVFDNAGNVFRAIEDLSG